jgi:hypothetical protein
VALSAVAATPAGAAAQNACLYSYDAFFRD